MRISDWSSDVCSSDLPEQGSAAAPILQRVRIVNAGADIIEIAFLVAIEPDHAQRELILDQRYVDHRIIALAERVRPGQAQIGQTRHAEFGQIGDRNSQRLNSSHYCADRMPSFA